MKDYNVVVRMKCGAAHLMVETDDPSEAASKLSSIIDVYESLSMVPLTMKANSWWVNKDEVREIRLEDKYQRVITDPPVESWSMDNAYSVVPEKS